MYRPLIAHIAGIWVSVRLLDGDIKQVKEAYPHLIVGPTIVARKMGFPEVIMPCESIYLQFSCFIIGLVIVILRYMLLMRNIKVE